jgi:hypothetical protein
VLAGLEVDRLVGRDDQEDDVDRRRARDHVLDEPLVAGDVDDADPLAVLEEKGAKPEIDRHLALFFLGQAVGVDAGEPLDERGLAVVDVARRSR